jgi:hypothetical protein
MRLTASHYWYTSHNHFHAPKFITSLLFPFERVKDRAYILIGFSWLGIGSIVSAVSANIATVYWAWRMSSSGMWRRVTLARTDVMEEHIIPIIRMRRIIEPGTMLEVTSNCVTLCYSCYLLINFLARRFMSPLWWRLYVPPKLASYKSHTESHPRRWYSSCIHVSLLQT